MFNAPINLSTARILISNDDGIHAPGLKVLEKIARQIAPEVWIVAPETEQSATGHSLTLRRPLRIREVSERKYAVDGTPTDCVLLAVNQIMKDHRPTLVLSGVNKGGNLGEDVTYSGTIAAAMEATILGIPSIALSQDCLYGDHPVKWATAEHFGPEVITKLCAIGWPENILLNVNFPDVIAKSVSGVEFCLQGKRKIGDDIRIGHDPRGEPYYWIGALRSENKALAETDLEAIDRGAITVTPFNLDLTDLACLAKLRESYK